MPIPAAAAMLIGTAVSTGTQLIGAKMQSNAAHKAVDAQQQATNQALYQQKMQHDEAVQRLQPFMNGETNLGRLLRGQALPGQGPSYPPPGPGPQAQVMPPPMGGPGPRPMGGPGYPPPGQRPAPWMPQMGGAPSGLPLNQMLRPQ